MKFYVEDNRITKAEIEVFKAISGEGSRGGHVIGHTKSGKPVYEVGFQHPSVSKFSAQDHKDAHRLHMGYAEYLDPHPEEGGGGYYNEGGEKFDPTKNPENGEKRAKFHIAQARLHSAQAGQKKDNFVVHPYIERAFSKFKDMIGGGLADKKKPKDFDKKQLATGKKVEMEHTNNPKVAQEIAMDHLTEDPKYYVKLNQMEKKSEAFVVDLMKGVTGAPRSNHKYIRRYRRGDKWVYVYHEPNQQGRVIPDEDIAVIHKLAAAGHKDSKDFLANVHDHDEEELKILRALADKGHKPSKDLLKEYGIDRDLEKVEEASVPSDKIIRDLQPDEKEKALQAIRESLKKMYDRFAAHPNSHFETSARNAGLSMESIMAAVQDKSNLRDILSALNSKMIELDRAHGTNVPSYDVAKAAGGYANMIYNGAVERMQDAGVLPANYNQAHKRTKENAASLEPHLESEHKVKMALIEDERRRAEEARLQREREERERREAEERAIHAELEGSMASFMNGLLSRPQSAAETLNLHRAVKRIFGKNLRKEDFPYNFEAQGIETKIESLTVSGDNIGLTLAFYRNGTRITEECRRAWNREGGRPHINNSYLTVPSSMRDGTNISNFINKGQRDLLRSLPEGGKITVYANIDIGGYTWANCGFSTTAMGELRSEFKSFLRGKGITLTDLEWTTFKDPVHIAQFDIGIKTVKTLSSRMPLSRKQIETGSITGVAGEHPLTEAERASGKTSRIAMSVGKEFLLRDGGRSWRGYWDSRMDNETTRFADQYYTLRDQAVQYLSAEYQATMTRVQNRRTETQTTPTLTVPADAPAVTPTSTPTPSVDGDRIRRIGNMWARNGRITMGARRLHSVATWTPAEKDFFITEFRSHLTRDAISKIRTTTPEQARARRTELRQRRRDARLSAVGDRARSRAETRSAASAAGEASRRSTTFAGYNTTHGEAIDRILNSDIGSMLGNSLAWYRENEQHLSGDEKLRLKDFFNRRSQQANIAVNDLVSRDILPENYKTMTDAEQREFFRTKFRDPSGFAAAGGTQHELDLLTDFLNLAGHRATFNSINEGAAAA